MDDVLVGRCGVYSWAVGIKLKMMLLVTRTAMIGTMLMTMLMAVTMLLMTTMRTTTTMTTKS